MFTSPFTDVIGRRSMVLICIVIDSLGMLLTAYANTLPQLAISYVLGGYPIGAMLTGVLATWLIPE